MKKKEIKNTLGLKKEAIAKLKGGAAAPGPTKETIKSYYRYCTWEIDCTSQFYSCDPYCTIA